MLALEHAEMNEYLEYHLWFMMKTGNIVLFFLGLAFLHHQLDGRRFVSEEVKTGVANNQFVSTIQSSRRLDVVSDTVKHPEPDDQPGKTASAPTVNGHTDKQTSSTSTSQTSDTDDDSNTSYGNFGNPSGSTTETHHFYTSDCQPKKTC
ncbi:hypothetical protein K2173_004049 [Erythroxylum novogranatense]|uniref:Uncharacterized protein n=1 Tax=Erythroxylum novogranatense TaxID=1862640 RepID=A0AAV8SJM3_9ROSI|nr:hypothetical protein K2173_004049 [Erythroxylum novogranatense]